MDIEANDAQHHTLSELSVLQREGKDWIKVPRTIFEDHYVDLDVPVEMEDNYVLIAADIEQLRYLRLKNYHADVWWPALVALDVLWPGHLTHISDLKAVLATIAYPAYIRTHVASPKDVVKDPIFYDEVSAETALLTSNRTKHDLTWLLWRPPIKLEYEVRVFVYHVRVTAASQTYPDWSISDKTTVLAGIAWLRNLVDQLPYWDCTVDIAYTQEWRILELNGFGADLNTGAGLFSWWEDYATLHGHQFEMRWVEDVE